MFTDSIGGVGSQFNPYAVNPKNSILQTLNSVISNMKETGEIARDVFNKLDQFKQEVNKQMDKSTLKKVGEELQQLATQLKNGDLSPKEAEQKVDDLLKMIRGTQVI
jgi:hypothetical protein